MTNELYHYTGIDTFKAIIESKNLRAYRYKSTNDTSEGMLGQRLVTNWYQSSEDLQNNLELGVSKFFDLNKNVFTRNLNDFPFFFCSFCSHKGEYEKTNGLLSMWRGYGLRNEQPPIAIVFKKPMLGNLVNLEKARHAYSYLKLKKSVYFNPEDLSELLTKRKNFLNYKNKFENALYKLNEALKNNDSNKKGSATKDIFEVYIILTQVLKHIGFKEENEWRVTGTPTKAQKINSIDSREMHTAKTKDNRSLGSNTERLKPQLPDNNNNRPYIELFKDDALINSIARVIVGPHPNQEQNANDIKEFLRIKQLDCIKVVCSSTPFNPPVNATTAE